jgi:hypothetical protein
MVIRSPEHEVIFGKKNHQRQIDWCTEKFGKRWSVIDNREGTWTCFWAGVDSPRNYRWLFKDEKDLVMFVLRWM